MHLSMLKMPVASYEETTYILENNQNWASRLTMQLKNFRKNSEFAG